MERLLLFRPEPHPTPEGIDARSIRRGPKWFDQPSRENAHGWKFIAFGPDGWLYRCGSALQYLGSRRTLRQHLSFAPDGSVLSRWRGVRNSVGFDWHPGTGEMWFTDNGRDGLGDDTPPDELNRFVRPGQHFISLLPRWTILPTRFRERHSCAISNHRHPPGSSRCLLGPQASPRRHPSRQPTAARLLSPSTGREPQAAAGLHRISLAPRGWQGCRLRTFGSPAGCEGSPWAGQRYPELPDGSLAGVRRPGRSSFRITYTPPRNPYCHDWKLFSPLLNSDRSGRTARQRGSRRWHHAPGRNPGLPVRQSSAVRWPVPGRLVGRNSAGGEGARNVRRPKPLPLRLRDEIALTLGQPGLRGAYPHPGSRRQATKTITRPGPTPAFMAAGLRVTGSNCRQARRRPGRTPVGTAIPPSTVACGRIVEASGERWFSPPREARWSPRGAGGTAGHRAGSVPTSGAIKAGIATVRWKILSGQRSSALR